MSINRLLAVAVSGWAIVVLASLATRAALFTSPVSLTESLAWVFVGCVPSAVFLVVFRGAPSPTIAQVLYSTEHQDEGARPRS